MVKQLSPWCGIGYSKPYALRHPSLNRMCLPIPPIPHIWCFISDSNRNAFRQWYLKPSCLPIPPMKRIKRGLQLTRICLLLPTPQFIGGHLTGSVARRSTFFIFRVPLMVSQVGLEPTMSLTTDLQSAALPIPLTDPYLTYIMDYIIFYFICQEVFYFFCSLGFTANHTSRLSWPVYIITHS